MSILFLSIKDTIFLVSFLGGGREGGRRCERLLNNGDSSRRKTSVLITDPRFFPLYLHLSLILTDGKVVKSLSL